MIADFSDHLRAQIQTLPSNPGVYRFYDDTGRLIYVGKAKNLKNRVTSYFSQEHAHYGKTRVMVKNIRDIQYIVVNSEMEALLLENSLIKQHQPKYNINLKDDKTYPYLTITREPFPRVYPIRNIPEGYKGELYGPYPSVGAMKTVLSLVRKLYKLRDCNLNMTPESVEAGKFKVCLEYHLGNCLAPCVGYQGMEDYRESVRQVRQIIKGNLSALNRFLTDKMQEHASRFEFEKAQEIKEKLDKLEKFRSKSVVVNRDIDEVDVFSIESDLRYAYVNYMHIVDGAVIQSFTLEIKKKLEEADEDILPLAIVELRERFRSQSREAVVPFVPEGEWENLKFTVPAAGDKKKLLDLSQTNLRFYIKDKQKQLAILDPERHTDRILEQMRKDLRLPALPEYMECFDNSNFQGDYAVSACVVFRQAKPSKKDYRIFNVKTVEGPDDFATMEEVIYRRYKRMKEEGEPLPQLVVIDGGKGQLGAALKSMEALGLRGTMTVVGIAKKLEEIYYPGDSLPLYIDKRSETLKVLQHMRDEAHRFGISHYRKRHRKGLIKTELDGIEGIGEKTAELLLTEFKSVKRIGEASERELAALIGPSKAALVKKWFEGKG